MNPPDALDSTLPTAAPPPSVSLAEALRFWLKLGFISFGGPAGQIALMHTELVERRRWISERRFLHALNFCMLLPGPEAQQLATYLGWLMHRTLGGVLAGVLFVLPSLFLIGGLAWIYLCFGHLPVIAGLFYGIKPAVVAIVLHAAHRVGSRALRNPMLWAIALAAFAAVALAQAPFPMVVAGAALVGLIGGRLRPAQFAFAGHAARAAALVDDDAAPLPHTRFQVSHTVKVALVGAALWAGPMALLVALTGWHSAYSQMAWFFTKAALLTVGGAYAVLPYVYQGAVETFGWATPSQMIDGLALGETTPGPLIMVVAFVAFIGGYAKALFGPDSLFLAGAVAACLVTWFTFLPSFLFIFAGGPLIETTHNNLRFTAPLTAITAAVVGVILNLAVFFGYHVLWPNGLQGLFDWPSALIAVAAGVALFKYQCNVIRVIIACGLLGVCLKWLLP
jgi:chromate transporter